MQRRGLFATGIVVLCAAGAVGYYQINKPHENTRDLTPGVKIDALALFTAYQTDERSSNNKFLGNVIGVSGLVAEVNWTGTAGSLILGNRGGGINCSFGPGTLGPLKNIHAGDSVSCKGRCTGFLVDVNLSDCVLEP